MTLAFLAKAKSESALEKIEDSCSFYTTNSEVVLIDLVTKQTLYYVKWTTATKMFLGFADCIQQVAVWRDPLDHRTEGVTAKVFFDYLLPKTGYIITDALQTGDGERSWEIQIARAFQRNLFVYFISFIPDRKIRRLKSKFDFYDIKKSAWGA